MSIYSHFEDKNVMESNGCFCTLNLPEAAEDDMVGGRLPPYAPVAKYLVDDYKCPSNWIKSKGTLSSYFCPVLENKGLWLDFNKNNHNEYDVAILISCQGINPITGLPFEEKLEQYEEMCPKCKKDFGYDRFCESCGYKWPKQNYLCTTGTPDGKLWLDGFRTIEGTIRQYILTEEKSKGVAANIIGEDRVYAIGITFFYSKEPRRNKVIEKKQNTDIVFGGPNTNWLQISNPYIRGINVPTPTNINYSSSEPSSQQLMSNVESMGNVRRKSKTADVAVLDGMGMTEQIGTTVVNTQALQEVPRTLEVGAGKQINQDVYDDPMKLDYWREEIQARICINYLHENLVNEILKNKKEKTNENKDGFLKEVPVAI